jgi:hypothetical protein
MGNNNNYKTYPNTVYQRIDDERHNGETIHQAKNYTYDTKWPKEETTVSQKIPNNSEITLRFFFHSPS